MRLRRLGPVALAASAAALALTCGEGAEPGGTEPEVVSGINVFAIVDTVNAVGQAGRFFAQVHTSLGHVLNALIKWSVTDTTVAQVTVVADTAVVRERRPGTVQVIAEFEGFADTATFVARQILASLQPSSTVIDTGFASDTFQLFAQGLDSAGFPIDTLRITWSSSDTAVAVVDTAGVVVSRQADTAKIFAAAGGFKQQILNLKVEAGPFTLVAAGTPGACGARGNGMTYCWPPGRPTRVDSGHVWRTLVAGGGFFCALTDDGTPYCWGGNGNGQLGTGDWTSSGVPVPVSTQLKFVTLGAGSGTCGVTAQHAAYCWGVINPQTLTDNWLSPQPLRPDLQFVDMQVGNLAGCGLTPMGRAYCWGTFSTDPALVPSQVPFKQVAVGGGTYTECILVSDTDTYCPPFACGLSLDGAPYCWDADRMYSAVAAVQTDLKLDTLVVGGGFACGLKSGIAYCWGGDGVGQLGDSTVRKTPADQITGTPVPVSGGHIFKTISASSSYACGVEASGGSMYCWGLNEDRELGSPLVACPGSELHCTPYPARVTRGRSLKP